MRKTILTIALLATMLSCNTKVDLFSDDAPKTVVYSVIDTDADTNFVKITKSFIGDASVLAHDYDACNYKYDEIKVWLVRVETNDSIRLDTVSKWIPYDANSLFYSGCRQTYYFTTCKIIPSENYQLVIKRNNGEVVTSTVKTINRLRFIFPDKDKSVSWIWKTDSLKWVVPDQSTNYQSVAAFLNVDGIFHYKELMPGATDTVEREILFDLKGGESGEMYNSREHNYKVTFKPEKFFEIIGKDEYLVNNSPMGVKRFVEKFEFRVTGMGQNLYEYIVANNSNISFQQPPEYSNIENGVGLFSTRFQQSQFNKLNQITRKRITNDYPFGFEYDPNW